MKAGTMFARRIAGFAAAALLVGCAGAGVKTGQYVDDSTVTLKVKTALLQAPNLESNNISVRTDNGEVHLSGFATNETDRRRAEVIARDVAGVKSVTNSIQVKAKAE